MSKADKKRQRIAIKVQTDNEELKRYLKQIRSKNKKDIHIKVKIKSDTCDINDTEMTEIMKEMRKALTRVNSLHNERISFSIKRKN